MKDVAFEVFQMKKTRRQTIVEGQWWNLALGDPFPIQNTQETLHIEKFTFKKWKVFMVEKPERMRKNAS